MKAHTLETQSTTTPEKALTFLKQGNERFVQNLKMNRNLLEQVNDTRAGQWPFAVVLSCIDSRTSAELIFDQGLGDIFSIRIAGNFVNRDILGSMEFGCNVAGSKLIVVLGHTKCGALKGGLDAQNIEGMGMENLNHLVGHFQGCIDSRTSAELIFDQGLGDVFSIRIAGNFVNRDILGSMEFGCNVAGSKLIVVLGHTKCGALKGGLDARTIENLGMENLNHLINHFEGCINEVISENEERSSSNEGLLERLNICNIRKTIADIRAQSTTLSQLEKEGKIKIVGANYCVESGVVTWLDENAHPNIEIQTGGMAISR